MTERACYFAAELADKLGMNVDTFYRKQDELHRRGMPQSVTGGRVRIPKKSFDAWLESPRGRQCVPPAPANDTARVSAQTDDEHRADLARHYGR